MNDTRGNPCASRTENIFPPLRETYKRSVVSLQEPWNWVDSIRAFSLIAHFALDKKEGTVTK